MADPFGTEDDPLALFGRWFAEAREAEAPTAEVMALATATREGRPSVRHVLLRGFDERGFVFYSNYQSRKGRELESNPFGSVALYWREIHRQVTATGRVGRLSLEESEAYWATRPRESQLAAWASRQSEVLAGPEDLDHAYEEAEARFHGDVPLPPLWGGYVLRPDAVEFWRGREHRLHHRVRFTKDPEGWWVREWLYP
jgi:pyridoxamine 5'-phosphate oxidase